MSRMNDTSTTRSNHRSHGLEAKSKRSRSLKFSNVVEFFMHVHVITSEVSMISIEVQVQKAAQNANN